MKWAMSYFALGEVKRHIRDKKCSCGKQEKQVTWVERRLDYIQGFNIESAWTKFSYKLKMRLYFKYSILSSCPRGILNLNIVG